MQRHEYEALCDEAWLHNRLYFQEGKPRISDDAYDQLIKRIEAIETEHPNWVSATSPTQRIGEKPLEGFPDVLHSQPMLSLAKVFSREEIEAFIQRVDHEQKGSIPLVAQKSGRPSPQEGSSASLRDLGLCGETQPAVARLAAAPPAGPPTRLLNYEGYAVELKLDGLAIAVIYEHGHLVQAITRGDGQMGSDVTNNIKTIRALPLRIATKSPLLEVRGEIYLPKAAFEALNRERAEQQLPLWANPRNAAAGSIKLLDPREVAQRHELSVAFYGAVRGIPRDIHTQTAVRTYLQMMGLPTLPDSKTCHSIDEIMAAIDHFAAQREALPFGIDGVVIKLDNLDAYASLGTTGKHPRGAVAYKFAAEEAWTHVRAITLQVGRTGVVTPVAELEPVQLAGSRITRATLHNFDELARKDIREGDYVSIQKGGDIIPQVVAIDTSQRNTDSTPYKQPTHCPACHTALTRDPEAVALRCPNPHCPAQLLRRLAHFAGKDGLDIEGLGEKVLEQLVQQGLVRAPADLFALTGEQLAALPGWQAKSVANLLAALERAKATPLARFLCALGIRYVGTQAAHALAATLSLDQLQHTTPEELTAIPGIGATVAGAIASYFAAAANRHEIEALLQRGVRIEKPRTIGDSSHPFYHKTVVLTGTLHTCPRHEAVARLQQQGASVANSLSKKTDYLIVGDEPGSKLQKAHELKVPTLTEAEFLRLLGDQP